MDANEDFHDNIASGRTLTIGGTVHMAVRDVSSDEHTAAVRRGIGCQPMGHWPLTDALLAADKCAIRARPLKERRSPGRRLEVFLAAEKSRHYFGIK